MSDNTKLEEQSFALDWRTLVGFSAVLAKLSRVLQKKLFPPVIIFYGRQGLGKSIFLRGVSSLFFCKTASACGQCAQCARVRLNEHSDLLVLTPHSGRHRLDNAILVQDHLAFKTGSKEISPFARRVVTLSDVELMTHQAVNRLLKTLEEPPSDTAVLMTTSSPKALLPTLRSRAIMWPLSPPSLKDSCALIQSYLKDRDIVLSTSQVEDELHRAGLAPGQVINRFLSQGGANERGADEISKMINGQPIDKILETAENLGRTWEGGLPSLVHELEVRLNSYYRSALATKDRNHVMTLEIDRTRKLLSQVRCISVKHRINLNLQLSVESFGMNRSRRSCS